MSAEPRPTERAVSARWWCGSAQTRARSVLRSPSTGRSSATFAISSIRLTSRGRKSHSREGRAIDPKGRRKPISAKSRPCTFCRLSGCLSPAALHSPDRRLLRFFEWKAVKGQKAKRRCPDGCRAPVSQDRVILSSPTPSKRRRRAKFAKLSRPTLSIDPYTTNALGPVGNRHSAVP